MVLGSWVQPWHSLPSPFPTPVGFPNHGVFSNLARAGHLAELIPLEQMARLQLLCDMSHMCYDKYNDMGSFRNSFYKFWSWRKVHCSRRPGWRPCRFWLSLHLWIMMNYGCSGCKTCQEEQKRYSSADVIQCMGNSVGIRRKAKRKERGTHARRCDNSRKVTKEGRVN